MHLHEKLSPRRTKDIGQAVRFLTDFPEEHRGNIVGLTNKAIRWHRDCWQEQAETETRNLADDLRVAVPPIPLPPVEGIRFLETVGDLRHESQEMKHCIRHYARMAKDGACYLFSMWNTTEITPPSKCRPSASWRSPRGPQFRNRGSRNGDAKCFGTGP